MLFGRKTPPAAPKPDSAAAAHATGPAAKPDEAATTLSPLASLNATADTPSPAYAVPSFARPAPSDSTPSVKGTEMNTSSPKPPTAPSLPGAGFKTDVPRRVVDSTGLTSRQPAPLGAAPLPPMTPALPDQRRLTVGRDISLSGEIGSCDVLIVEGTVEAKLREGRSIEVANGGLFKGSVEIDEADIGGRFEGDIAVRGRLVVRSTGRINGSVKYGELTVEPGGQLSGSIALYTETPKTDGV